MFPGSGNFNLGNELKIKGTPSLSIGPDLGLILKTVRNGNFETYATKIDFQKVDQ